MAPLIPQAMYRSGAIRVPVWPTCWACGRQPAEVTTRDTPTVPPSSAASSSSWAKPSALPTPRPPPTTTRASASEILPASAGTRAVTRTRKSRSVSSGVNDWTGAAAPRGRDGRLERVRRRGQQAGRALQPGLLEQAAAPALAGDLPRVAGPDLGAVGRQREARPGRDVGQHLRAPVAAGARRPRPGRSRSTSWARALPSASGA